MTPLALHLTAFLREYLPGDRAYSAHTCDAYAYSFQLLLCFAAEQHGTPPSALTLEQLDAPLVLAFLEHIETVRGNSARTRNARLAAIKAFTHFIEYRVPSAVEQVRCIQAIPFKKTDEALVDYLNHQELQALLDAPEPTTRAGTRDRALVAGPAGNHTRSTAPGHASRKAAVHSILVGHKTRREFFCCVTTRGPCRQLPCQQRHRYLVAAQFGHAGVSPPPRRAAFGWLVTADKCAGAWLLASAAVGDGILPVGNSVDSSEPAGKHARILCTDTLAAVAVWPSFWIVVYPVVVPWECLRCAGF